LRGNIRHWKIVPSPFGLNRFLKNDFRIQNVNDLFKVCVATNRRFGPVTVGDFDMKDTDLSDYSVVRFYKLIFFSV
jgi:hypothetical protein